MRRHHSLSTVAICSTLLMGLLAGSPFAVAGESCAAKLVNLSYACNFKLSDGSSATDCIEFIPASEGPSQDFNFFDHFLSPTTAFGCACDNTGSYKSPKFDSSSGSFECVDESGIQINGKLKGKKISGQGTYVDGDSLIYTCTIGPSCG